MPPDTHFLTLVLQFLITATFVSPLSIARIAASDRVFDGLQVLYDFSDVSGNQVRSEDGSLQIQQPTRIATPRPPKRLIQAHSLVRRTDRGSLVSAA